MAKKLSAREKWAAAVPGRDKHDYPGSSSSKSGGSSFDDILDSILGATPGFQDPVKPFEEIYTAELDAEDQTQAEALFKPHYEKKVSDMMEDLNAWSEMESVNYKRTMRQGRASMAAKGAAIGQGASGERQKWEGEVTDQSNFDKEQKVRETEQAVGSGNITNKGYTSFYGDRVGTIVDEMNAEIENQKLWYRNQRADRYYADANRAQQQTSNKNILGNKL